MNDPAAPQDLKRKASQDVDGDSNQSRKRHGIRSVMPPQKIIINIYHDESKVPIRALKVNKSTAFYKIRRDIMRLWGANLLEVVLSFEGVEIEDMSTAQELRLNEESRIQATLVEVTSRKANKMALVGMRGGYLTLFYLCKDWKLFELVRRIRHKLDIEGSVHWRFNGRPMDANKTVAENGLKDYDLLEIKDLEESVEEDES